MKEIQIHSFCDYPGCADAAKSRGLNDQETSNVLFHFYAIGRGRPTKPIRVEFCDDHRREFIILMKELSVHAQPEKSTDA